MADLVWIERSDQLREQVSTWLQSPFVALDTEFVRERTYYPGLGLIQLAVADEVCLVDPLAIDDLADILRPLLVSTEVEKVFHAGEEDLEIFGSLLEEPVRAVMDTQLMLGFVTGEASVGYARLVESRLGEHVPKDQTRSNWLQRPLSARQCEYAANDVRWLQRLYPELRQQVAAKGRIDWVREDTDRLAAKVLARDNQQYYLGLRQAHDLRGNRLWLLQQLAARREARCQALDVNRKALISDNDLITLARKRPDSIAAISELTEIRPGVLRREAQWVLELIKASHTVTASQYPARIQEPLPRDYMDHFQALRAVMSEQARQHGLPREYLMRKRDLENFLLRRIRGDADFVPSAWEGWRWTLFGSALEEKMTQRLAIMAHNGEGS